MDYKEFRIETVKARIPRKAKVSGSWGIYSAYKHIRKNKWYDIGRPLTEHEFYSVIRNVNNLIAEKIKKGETVIFPSRMGTLELIKAKRGVKIKNGKLVVQYPIDWDKTLRLWAEDPEARNSKTLVRHEVDYVYKVRYKKFTATYNNKIFYEFDVNRFIKRGLKNNIINGVTDTLW